MKNAQSLDVAYVPRLMGMFAVFPSRFSNDVKPMKCGELELRTFVPPDARFGSLVPRHLFILFATKLKTEHDPDVDRENHVITLRGTLKDLNSICHSPRGGRYFTIVVTALKTLPDVRLQLRRGERLLLDTALAENVTMTGRGSSRKVTVSFSESMWRVLEDSVPLNPNTLAELGKSPRLEDFYFWTRVKGLESADSFVLDYEDARLQFDYRKKIMKPMWSLLAGILERNDEDVRLDVGVYQVRLSKVSAGEGGER